MWHQKSPMYLLCAFMHSCMHANPKVFLFVWKYEQQAETQTGRTIYFRITRAMDYSLYHLQKKYLLKLRLSEVFYFMIKIKFLSLFYSDHLIFVIKDLNFCLRYIFLNQKKQNFRFFKIYSWPNLTVTVLSLARNLKKLLFCFFFEDFTI